MGSPNSDYLSPCGEGDGTSADLYDEAVLLELESQATQTEAEIHDDDERLYSSPITASCSKSFTSHWTQPWSKNTEIFENPQKSLPLDNGPSPAPAQNSVERPVLGAGMENLGNTCFLNSVLQCLIHTVPLLNAILSNGHLLHSNCNKEGFCLLRAMRDLIVDSLTNVVVSPCNIVNNLSYISSSFQRFRQEDAHEFLQCFLDRLETCHDPKNKGCMSSQSDNIVKQVFGGRLVSYLKCCNCGHCSDTYEPLIDLSLEIDDAFDLYTALQSFTKVERLEDPETKFTCQKCKEQVSVEKKLSFDQAPEVAVFHLKRFKSDGCFVEKIDKHVAFPFDLDLLPFTGSGEINHVELKYVLYAIVVHTGLTSTSGHYYSFIRVSPKMWCKFDDSRVTLVHEEFVLSQEAYVLLYAKESTPWFSSFIERQKGFVHSTTWNASPRSVLDNIDTSSVSPSSEKKIGCNSNDASCDFESKHRGADVNEMKHTPNEVDHDFGSEHGGAGDNQIKHSGPMKNKIESNGSTYESHGMSSVALCSSDSSNSSLPKTQKVSPILLEKVKQSQEVDVVTHCQNDTQTETALRSPSPEIYREDPPDFSIPRDHLQFVDRMSCKRRLEKDMDDMEMRQARSFIKKNMPSSRGQQLLAALRGPKNEVSVNRKKSRRSGLSNDSSASTHHDINIRPSLRRVLAGTNK